MATNIGVRVVRGPDWRWNSQDDGEGHVGTVVEVGRHGSTTSPDKTVVVQWDSGLRTNYRVGYQGAFDLKVYDSSPIGVKHPNIVCDGCKTEGIFGIRWKCTICPDYDLCTTCYMSDIHVLSHIFLQYETQHSKPRTSPPRKDSRKCQSYGVFVDAKVVRGPDWDWGDQDGGSGEVGRVLEVLGWESETGRSVVRVSWALGTGANVYRMGHKGKVDLKYVDASRGGPYYVSHLPKLGEIPENITEVDTTTENVFNVGDKVKVMLDVDILKHFQEGHGGWNPKMGDFIGRVGTVHRVTERGDIRVQYENSHTRWTFHAAALTKMQNILAGDRVKVSSDVSLVQRLQAGHGEWHDDISDALGLVGNVVKVYSDGDVRVQINRRNWTFNPLCVRKVISDRNSEIHDKSNEIYDPSNCDSAHRRCPSNVGLKIHLAKPLVGDSNSPDRLVNAAAQGWIGKVEHFITQHPEQVNTPSGGKTALHVAAYQGHIEIVKFLLNNGALLEATDNDGDTALHYSSFGNEAGVAAYLLSQGSDIDQTNDSLCSALHVAVNKAHFDVVSVLLEHTSDVNIQDSYGDTVLHDAISKDNSMVLNLLLMCPTVDLYLKNGRGFNVLHHACLKGNVVATTKILNLTKQMVDLKKDDGFSALHLASLNGHCEVAEKLITLGNCDVDLKNNRCQTPLHLAVSQGHVGVAQLLVTYGASVNSQDEDCDTCLHIALLCNSREKERADQQYLQSILTEIGLEDCKFADNLALACYLVYYGASLSLKNNLGKTPLDLVTDPATKSVLRNYSDVFRQSIVDYKDCMMCDGQADCQFLPCGHITTCYSCVSEMVQFRKCYKCKQVVERYIKLDTVKPPECMVCSDGDAVVRFDPCGHIVVCDECAVRMKKCLQCQSVIACKTTMDGCIISNGHKGYNIEMQTLKSKLQEVEEQTSCIICMERKKDVAFICGHMTCSECSHSLTQCPMCRKRITQRINVFQ